MRVIFLDVDGVLNNGDTEELTPNGFIGVDEEKISLLAKIVKATEAIIVLVSSWKEEWDIDTEKRDVDAVYLDEKLAKSGLIITDKTNDCSCNRGEGIQNWLGEHPDVTSWIVLDDEIFSDYGEFDILPHLVQTSNINPRWKRASDISSFWSGLNEKTAEEAIGLMVSMEQVD